MIPSPSRIGVCLLLGCVTTIVVAWLLAIRVVVPVSPNARADSQGMYRGVDGGHWWYSVQRRPGLTVVVRERGRRLELVLNNPVVRDRVMPYVIFTWAGRQISDDIPVVSPAAVAQRNDIPPWARQPVVDPTVRPYVVTAASARGWPCRVVWYEATITMTARVNGGGIELPPSLRDLGPGSVLPYRLIPVGFSVNAVLYGAAWMLLLAVPGLVRRATRHRHGQCVACGYDLRHAVDERCPECGLVSGDVRPFPIGWRPWASRSTSH